MNDRTYEPLEAPEYRRAYANEVVQLDGRYWRLVYQGQRFSGCEDVTADVAEYYASVVLEARIRAVHGTVLASLRTFGVGRDNLIEAFVAPLAVN
jgi:hypothetical protein